MSKKTVGAIEWTITEDGYVHLIFMDENGERVFATAMDVGFWDELVDEIDEAIEDISDEGEIEEVTKH